MNISCYFLYLSYNDDNGTSCYLSWATLGIALLSSFQLDTQIVVLTWCLEYFPVFVPILSSKKYENNVTLHKFGLWEFLILDHRLGDWLSHHMRKIVTAESVILLPCSYKVWEVFWKWNPLPGICKCALGGLQRNGHPLCDYWSGENKFCPSFSWMNAVKLDYKLFSLRRPDLVVVDKFFFCCTLR